MFKKRYGYLIAAMVLPMLIMIFSTGDQIISFLLSMLLFLSAFITWLVMMIYALVSRRLRNLISITISGIFGVSLAGLCLLYSDQIHFQVMRPIYLHQIKSAGKEVTEKDWDWGGSFESQTDLLYFRNVTASDLAVEQDNRPCTTTIEKMSDHFFVIDINC